MLAVTGMAVKIGDLAKTMAKEVGRTLHEPDLIKCAKPIAGSNAAIHGNLVCSSDTPYLEANARSYYDWAIKNSALNIKKKIGAREFLESCGFACYADLCPSSIKRQSRTGQIRIGVLGKAELDALYNSETLYGTGSALMLFLRLNNAVKMIKC